MRIARLAGCPAEPYSALLFCLRNVPYNALTLAYAIFGVNILLVSARFESVLFAHTLTRSNFVSDVSKRNYTTDSFRSAAPRPSSKWPELSAFWNANPLK